MRLLRFLPLLALLSGCGDGAAEVRGKITYDGKAIEAGAIQFVPVDGKSRTAGSVITNGEYSARVPIGLMKVSISGSKTVGTKKLYNTPNSPEMPLKVEALPEKYNQDTTLEYEVKPGENNKDFVLEK